jgi:hypothetical protein
MTVFGTRSTGTPHMASRPDSMAARGTASGKASVTPRPNQCGSAQRGSATSDLLLANTWRRGWPKSFVLVAGALTVANGRRMLGWLLHVCAALCTGSASGLLGNRPAR